MTITSSRVVHRPPPSIFVVRRRQGLPILSEPLLALLVSLRRKSPPFPHGLAPVPPVSSRSATVLP